MTDVFTKTVVAGITGTAVRSRTPGFVNAVAPISYQIRQKWKRGILREDMFVFILKWRIGD